MILVFGLPFRRMRVGEGKRVYGRRWIVDEATTMDFRHTCGQAWIVVFMDVCDEQRLPLSCGRLDCCNFCLSRSSREIKFGLAERSTAMQLTAFAVLLDFD